MTTPNIPATPRTNLPVSLGRSPLTLLAAASLLLASLPSTSFGASGTWNGGTSTDWNTAANWTGGVPAATGTATINSVPANICTITATTPQPNDIFVGSAASTTGRVDHRAGLLQQAVIGSTGNWVFIGGNATGVGTYNLADTSVTGQPNLTTFGQGSGSVTIGKLWVGGRDNAAGTGTVNINTTGTLAAQSTASGNSGSVIVGSQGGTGTLNLDSGTVTASGNLWIGYLNGAASSTGTVNVAGGTINAGTIWMCTNNGTATTVGTLNITNGTVNASGRVFVTYGTSSARLMNGTVNVGNGGILNSEADMQLAFAGASSATGTVNIATGGTINVATTTPRWLIMNQWDPMNAAFNVNGGTLNLNANTALQFGVGNNNSGTAIFSLNSGAVTMWSGNNTGVAVPSATAAVINMNNAGSANCKSTVNLNGGTLTVGGVIASSTAGTRVFNFNGGTLKPTTNNASFFAAGRASTANVRNGGAVINDGGWAVTIGQVLSHSSISGDNAVDGGFTKLGAGTNTLTGANTFNGPVLVGGGTLYANPGNAANNRAFSYVSSITVSNGATLQAGPNGLFGWDGTQEKPITVNSGGVLTANGGLTSDVGVGTVTLAGGTLATIASGATDYGSWRFDNAGDKLVASDDSTASAVNVKFANGGAIDVAAGKTLNFTGTITDTSFGGGSTVVKSGGTGTLNLSGANTYTGSTTISNGTLKLSATGTIPNTPTITVASGATFDVSAAGFTLGAGKTLQGNGAVLGTVTSAGSTSVILPGSSAGTLTFNNNLNLSAGASTTFELSTVYNSGNDQIVVGGNLNLGSSDVIHIDAISDAANLDTNADYVLFDVAGTTTMSGTPALVWDGTPPANYLNFTVVQSGNDVVLRYTAATAPTVVAVADPATATRNQSFGVTATVTNGSGNIVSVVVDVSQVGGSVSASLVLSNNNVFTNTFTVTSGTTTGTKSFLVTVTDDTSPTPLVGSYTITPFTVVATNQLWSGAGSDDDWTTNPNWTSGAAPALSGDSVTFTGSTRTTPNLNQNFSVTGLTFDSAASSFTIGTGNSSTLTLTGGVTNDSANAQTVNVPVSLPASQTVSATGDVTIGGAITGAGGLTKVGNGTLTLAGGLTAAGVLQGNGGTTVVASAVSPGGSEVWAGAVTTGTITVPSGGSLVVSNWLVAGRSGTGTINVNGGSLVHAGGGNITLGTLGTTPSGTINLTSGTISNLFGETYLGEGSSAVNFGNYNQSGGYATLGNFYVGRGSGGGQGIGTANITGGTLDVAALEIGFGNNNTRIGTNVMTIGAGATVNASGSVRLAFAGSATLWGILTNNGGILNVGAAHLYLGYWDPSSSELTMNSGQINLRNNAEIRFANNSNSSGTHTFNHNDGTVTFYSDAGVTVGGTGSLNINNAGSGACAYNLNGGTLTVPKIRDGGVNTGTSTLNLNGGTLKAAASSTTFMEGLSAANVQSGGAIIDTDGKNITIAQALLDGGGGGGLTKNGNGTLALNGVNTFTGLTTVNAGTLGGTGSLAGGLSVGASATLAAGNSIGAFTVNGATTLSGAVVAEITNGPSADLLNFAGGATLGGTLTVVANGTLTSGQTFNLFDGSLAGTFSTVTLPGGPAHWNTSALYTSGEITYANASPAANNFGLGVVVGGSATVQAVGKYVSDADGDAVTITSVSTPANGTAVIVGGTNITYTSTVNAASDSFTYTVTDSLGAMDTKTVTVSITSPTGFNLISGPTPVGGGQFQLNYLGIPGQQYAIEETASLAPPITWTPAATNTAAGNGALSFTITPSNPSGYFRTRSVP